MADVKISGLPASTVPLGGTEVLPIVQSGVSKKVSVADLTVGRAISATQLTLTTGSLIVANGQGVDFSATEGTGTSELLDDYEEGTWTAVIKGLTTAGVYETQNNNCTYQKIGNRCFVQARIRMANALTGGGAGAAVVAGLPYSKSSDSLPVGSVFFANVAFIGIPVVAFYTFGGSSELYFPTNVTLSEGSVGISDIGVGDFINFCIDYQVA